MPVVDIKTSIKMPTHYKTQMPVEDIKISTKMPTLFKTQMPVEDIKTSIKMPTLFKTQMLEIFGQIRLVTGWVMNIMAN